MTQTVRSPSRPHTILGQPVELLLPHSGERKQEQHLPLRWELSYRTSLWNSWIQVCRDNAEGIDLKNAVLILAQKSYLLDPLKLPGRAYTFYDGGLIKVEQGVNFFRITDLGKILPIVRGLKVLGIPETKLALQELSVWTRIYSSAL
jgi:hypothetical protein